MEALIRRAAPDDLERVLLLENACFTDPWTPGMFRDALGAGGFEELYLLELDGIDVGCICLYIFENEGEIMSLCVLPDHRRRGFGKSLLDFGLGLMKERGVTDVFLEVRRGNESAIALYENAGFCQIGVRKNYYRRPTEDAHVLKKSII